MESTQKQPHASRHFPWPVTLVTVFLLAICAADIRWAFRHPSGQSAAASDEHATPARGASAPPHAPSKEPPAPTLPPATKAAPFVNTLGMKFVPVPGTKVLFSVWETRVQDYRAFVDAKKLAWDKPRFTQGPTHPAVNVSYEDAMDFCQWLTEKEGLAAQGLAYRLPTDAEWSAAVGLVGEQGATPKDKGKKATQDVFPWGTAWPPPARAGNFADETAKKGGSGVFYIDGYDDGFAYTSPAGEFTPNAFGLYDLSGNVWEWCADWYDAKEPTRVMRGASWCEVESDILLSSYRNRGLPEEGGVNRGFRCVLVAVGGASAPTAATPAPPKAPALPTAPLPAALATAKKDAPLVNTLGMKFVPVPGTKVLFSVWETRVQDYQAFVDAKKLTWEKANFPQGPTHPAVNLNYEDAVAFCRWLTEKEGLAAQGLAYRLPTDAEWSAAVGLVGEQGATPLDKDLEGPGNTYPWGLGWPPPPRAGNFSDETAKKAGSRLACVDGYDDGFAYTSPAGEFTPNAFGLYDLSGNAWEWCADWYNDDKFYRVMRGGSWDVGRHSTLLSSYRCHIPPKMRYDRYGFRCVLGSSAP